MNFGAWCHQACLTELHQHFTQECFIPIWMWEKLWLGVGGGVEGLEWLLVVTWRASNTSWLTQWILIRHILFSRGILRILTDMEMDVNEIRCLPTLTKYSTKTIAFICQKSFKERMILICWRIFNSEEYSTLGFRFNSRLRYLSMFWVVKHIGDSNKPAHVLFSLLLEVIQHKWLYNLKGKKIKKPRHLNISVHTARICQTQFYTHINTLSYTTCTALIKHVTMVHYTQYNNDSCLNYSIVPVLQDWYFN